MDMIRKYATQFYDFVGISSAALCMMHCMALPILTILPFGLFDEIWIDTLFACIGSVVVYKVLKSDASKLVKIILTISINSIILSVLLDFFFDIHSGLILIGGSGMIVGHLLNLTSHHKNI